MSDQGVYWRATISFEQATLHSWHPGDWFADNEEVRWFKGQQEIGEGGFHHYQTVFALKKKKRLNAVIKLFDPLHPNVDLTYSTKANDYVWKEDTRVEGTQFEYGVLAFKNGDKTDWAKQMELARAGEFGNMEPSIAMRYWGNIVRIHSYFLEPPTRSDVVVNVLIGPTGTGKTFRAYQEATNPFVKPGRTKWWDGYRSHEDVIIDEFSGSIAIENLLTWTDVYPCQVECKNGATPLFAKRFWITSNLEIEAWYPEANPEHLRALKRRITCVRHLMVRHHVDREILINIEDENDVEVIDLTQ